MGEVYPRRRAAGKQPYRGNRHRRQTPPPRPWFLWLVWIGILFGLVASFSDGKIHMSLAGVDSAPSRLGSSLSRLVSWAAADLGFSPAGCNIKGNISINTGEHIYHVPGQKFYAATRINSRYGERWFCSEDEARRAGWRKARR